MNAVDMSVNFDVPKKFEFGKYKVLVAEDDPVLAAEVLRELRAVGFQAELVSSFETATALLSKERFSAVITDVRLGGVAEGGIELLKSIQNLLIPVVVVATFADSKTIKSALNAGASYFLEKPFAYTELVQALTEKLQGPSALYPLIDQFSHQSRLTNRERDISRLVFKGLSSKEIAEATKTSEKTVKCHLNSIFKKAKVNSRAELFSKVFKT